MALPKKSASQKGAHRLPSATNYAERMRNSISNCKKTCEIVFSLRGLSGVPELSQHSHATAPRSCRPGTPASRLGTRGTVPRVPRTKASGSTERFDYTLITFIGREISGGFFAFLGQGGVPEKARSGVKIARKFAPLFLLKREGPRPECAIYERLLTCCWRSLL